MKNAVIGSGISGLSSAYFLSKKFKVDLFEQDDHFGGHSYTYDIKDNDKKFILDFNFKFKVILIGIGGEIKYQSDELEDLTKYFSIIDNMPIRQTEIEDDSSCN